MKVPNRVVSLRVSNSTLCQCIDILEKAGITTANMALSAVLRLIVESACRAGVKQGLTIPYTEDSALIRLANNYDVGIELDLDSVQETPSTPQFVAPTVVQVQDKRELVEKGIQPYIQTAREKLDAERFAHVLDVQASEARQAPSAPTPKRAPWETSDLHPASGVSSITTASPFAQRAVETKDRAAILAIMIALPSLPTGTLGTDIGEKLFANVKDIILTYCHKVGVEVPDPYNLQ